MTNKRLLISSITILILTTVIVAIFGIVPLPEYVDLSSENNFEGKLIYFVEIQSENIIPPAPDIIDSCIFYIDLSADSLEEEKVVCSSDLYNFSYDINFYDAQIYDNNNIILPYWDGERDSLYGKVLIVDIESGEVFKSLAPSNYYFESLHWSPDGNNIIAGDSENNLIIFSKNKEFNPLRVNLNSELVNDERLDFIRVLGWTN